MLRVIPWLNRTCRNNIGDCLKWGFKKFFFSWTRCLVRMLCWNRSKPIIKYWWKKIINAEITKSHQKGFFLFHAQGMEHDQWLCLYYQNPDDGSKINDREVQKNTHIKSKGQCKDKISVSKRIHIFSCTTMIAKHLT